MAVPTFTLTGDLSTFTLDDRPDYGPVRIQAYPPVMPVPGEGKVLVQPEPVATVAGVFSVQLAAVEGVTYTARVAGHSVTFAAAAAGATVDLADVTPVLAPAPTTAYLVGPRGAVGPSGPSQVTMWGHSYVDGVWSGGGPGEARTLAPTTAALLGVTLDNRGAGGSLLADSLQGWGPLLQALSAVDRARFVPRLELHVLLHGLNDLGTTSTHDLAAFTRALYAVVSRMRAGFIVEDDDPTTAYSSGNWAAFTPFTDRNSGTGLHYTPVNGESFTITTPADFPGGTIALGFTSWSDGGAVVTSEPINGETYALDTSAYFQDTTFSHGVLRIPEVPAGAASYAFTVSGVVGAIGCMFDYWQWEQPTTEGVSVVLVKQPKLVDYSPYLPQVVTDADVDALNAVLDQCATDFGPKVVTVDAGIDHREDCFIAGNVHPTLLGHRLIAEAIAAAAADVL